MATLYNEYALRLFVQEALAKAPEGKALAQTKTGTLRAYAEGMCDGVEEALRQVLQFLDEHAVTP